MSAVSTENARIIETIIPEQQRLEQLPEKFGQRFLLVENAIYQFMEQLCDQYNGGYWEFYALSNGGFYMAPAMGNSLKIAWSGNYFEGSMTAQAAGIVACLFAYSYAAMKGSEEASEMFHRLRDYVYHHEERDLIFRAID